MIKDTCKLTGPICKELGISNDEDLQKMAKNYKFYVFPRFYRYREYYKQLDLILESNSDTINL